MEASDGLFFQISADGTLAGPDLPVAGAAGIAALWRAVDPTELAALKSTGRYEIPYGGNEGKYFYPTQEQAEALAAKMAAKDQVPYTVTSAQVDNSLLANAWAGNIGGEGDYYYLRRSILEGVELVKIFE